MQCIPFVFLPNEFNPDLGWNKSSVSNSLSTFSDLESVFVDNIFIASIHSASTIIILRSDQYTKYLSLYAHKVTGKFY